MKPTRFSNSLCHDFTKLLHVGGRLDQLTRVRSRRNRGIGQKVGISKLTSAIRQTTWTYHAQTIEVPSSLRATIRRAAYFCAAASASTLIGRNAATRTSAFGLGGAPPPLARRGGSARRASS